MNYLEAYYRLNGMKLNRRAYESPDERLACVRELSENCTLRPSPYDLRMDDPPAPGPEAENQI